MKNSNFPTRNLKDEFIFIIGSLMVLLVLLVFAELALTNLSLAGVSPVIKKNVPPLKKYEERGKKHLKSKLKKIRTIKV